MKSAVLLDGRWMRLLSFCAVLAMTLGAALPAVPASSESTTQTSVPVTYGVTEVFEMGDVTVERDDLLDCFDGRTTCTAQTHPEPKAASTASLTNTVHDLDAEAATGIEWHLVPACTGQEMLTDVQVQFDYEYKLATRVQNDPFAQATAAIVAHGTSPTDGGEVADSASDGQGVWDWTEDSHTVSVAPDTSRIYQSVLGARSTVSISTDLDEQDEKATASAESRLLSVTVDSGDTTPPTSTFTVTPASAPGSSPDFLGWYNEPVTVEITAQDPTRDDEDEPIANSCVSHVNVLDEDEDLAKLYLNDAQDPVSHTLDSNERYDLRIRAVDKNGNAQAQPGTVTFGYDDVRPVTDIVIKPGNPNGNNGWYKYNDTGTQVHFNLTCDDDPNRIGSRNVAGCTTLHYVFNNGVTWRDADTARWYDVDAPQGDGVFIRALFEDRAGNQDLERDTQGDLIKVDLYAPNVTRENSVTSVYDNDWFKEDVTVTFGCDNTTEVSGCAFTRVRVNTEEDFRANEPLPFSDEGENYVDTQTEDVAGNVKAVHDHKVHIDKTAPGPVSDLGLLPVFYEDEDGNEYVNHTPTWTWTAAQDTVSGIQEYHLEITDGTYAPLFNTTTTDTSYTLPALGDGTYCLLVSAIDLAGNEGSDKESCVTLDTATPWTNLTWPDPYRIYFPDGEWLPYNTTDEESVVIGGIWIRTESVDDGPADMRSTRIYDDNVHQGLTELACDNADDQAHRCDFHDRHSVSIDGQSSQRRDVVVEGYDWAGNWDRSYTNYTKVDLGAVNYVYEEQNGGETVREVRTKVAWLESQASNFVRYVLHRSPDPDFVPIERGLDGSTEVYRTTNAGDVTYVDEDVNAGETWYYKVVTVEGLTSHASHEVVLEVQSLDELDASGFPHVSDPVGCGNWSCY